MDKRSTFRTYDTPPAAADISIGSKKRRPWRLLILIGFVCVILVTFQFWRDDEYIAGLHIAPQQAKDSWSHLIFHATGDKQIKNTKNTHSSDGTKDTSDDRCKVPRFDPKTKHPPYVSCKRVPPIPDSCDTARKLFLSKPKPMCPDQRELIICQMENYNTSHGVSCTNNMCASDISLGLINPLDGTLVWSIYPDINDLENAILDLLNKNASNGNYGFCYLKCKQKNQTIWQSVASYTTILYPEYM
ncbi:uncharacterized protein [Amphiura filiformis]|uniref:uncharacterized protein n=1 Tax=Amphiura filiformis TaxID=82378 RepID=UPI003B21CD6B